MLLQARKPEKSKLDREYDHICAKQLYKEKEKKRKEKQERRMGGKEENREIKRTERSSPEV